MQSNNYKHNDDGHVEKYKAHVDQMGTEEQQQQDEKNLEEPPKKKLRVVDAKNARTDDNRKITEEEDETVISSNFPVSCCRLPLELECEVFKCLTLPIQRTFVSEMGRGNFGYFGPRIRAILQAKRIVNPERNYLSSANSRYVQHNITNRLLIMMDRLSVETRENVYAKKRFIISPKSHRKDRFAGIIVNYFEVTQTSTNSKFLMGLSNSSMPSADGADLLVGQYTYSYSIENGYAYKYCWLSGKKHLFEWPLGSSNRLEWNDRVEVMGCGILLSPQNKLALFFTANGIFLGRQIPLIHHHAELRLYPTIAVFGDILLEANFGDNPAKPFKYDIQKLSYDPFV